MGIGFTTFPGGHGPDMSMTIGFNKVVHNTKWRWGVEGGIINQGLADYFFNEDEPDRFVRPDFTYAGFVADYSLYSTKDYFSLFARGGLAPARQRDVYIYHTENKYTVLGIIGIGADVGFSKFMLSGYIVPDGIFIMHISYGWWFGKRQSGAHTRHEQSEPERKSGR